MRAVIDANVFISSLIGPNSVPARIFLAWQANAFVLVLSMGMYDEWLEVVGRPETSSFFRRTPEWISAFMAQIQGSAHFCEPVAVTVVADDPDDNLIVGTAVAGEADFIVSGDKHLLALGAYGGIEVVTPRRFLDLLEVGDLRP